MFNVKPFIPSRSYNVGERLRRVNMLTGKCSAIMKFTVKDSDPTTGLPDSDDGYEDDYVVSKQIISFNI
jgi:hypothetical protein